MTGLRTTPQRSDLMRRVRQSGTAPELLVRQLLTSVGAKYRLNVRGLPGSPDIANKSRRKAIFVHGCYWHGHQGCRRATVPKANRDFWSNKFQRNRQRDAEKLALLQAMRFDVLVVWECEVFAEGTLQERLSEFWHG
jgi:DNA mismatch endonuclease, patch repair protein